MCELCSSCGRNRKWVETHCVWCGGDLVCSECDATLIELTRENDELKADIVKLEVLLMQYRHVNKILYNATEDER